MSKVRLLNGKPLMVGGKVATSDDCCCQPENCFCDTADCGGGEHVAYFTFSGISVACGCVDLSSINPDTSRIITSASLNGTITANCVDSVWSGVNEAMTFNYNGYQDSFCSDLQVTAAAIPSVYAWCDGSTLRVALTDNISVLFYGSACALDTPYDNESFCQALFADNTIPPGVGFGPSVGSGFNGQVTVSITPP